jgi:structural maintenance of chromosome 2
MFPTASTASKETCSFSIFFSRFDPHFNAITGLNGSGKSNILDAICFVLGITNLSQVRAGNLSELVYKQGQAGVQKATVTIVFNNADPESSPVGYENCPEVTVTRQVLLGGKSKYQVNGRTTPAGQVQDLFHSVQLNVNNPHFLIMQGRITKVLNMKPDEILGMVEEAAGTRMYEAKRVGALKTIEKKQCKLDEFNKILAEEITPTLERLRGEKQSYLKWSKNTADIERIERFVIAHDFDQASKALQSNTAETEDMEQQEKSWEAKVLACRNDIANKDDEITERSKKLKGEFEATFGAAKASVEKHSKELVKVTSILTNRRENVTKAEQDLTLARTALQDATDAASSKAAQTQMEEARCAEQAREAREAESRVAQLSVDFQNMSAGVAPSQEDRTLPEQIARAHGDSKTAEGKVKQAKMKISHLTKQLKVRTCNDL